jgi:hypothetical protein
MRRSPPKYDYLKGKMPLGALPSAMFEMFYEYILIKLAMSLGKRRSEMGMF